MNFGIYILITVVFIGLIILIVNKKAKKSFSDEVFDTSIEEEIHKYIDSELNAEDESSLLDYESLTKKNCIAKINYYLGDNRLNSKNTNYANLNKEKLLWWFNIDPLRFKEDLHLILVDVKGFKWITIPEKVAHDPNDKFVIREDKGLVDLLISAQPGYYFLRDIRSGASGFSFKPYIVKEFKK